MRDQTIPCNALNEGVCGARTRAGTPCRRAPMRGRKRCRLHGGATPVGQCRAAGGLYSRDLTTRALAWARVLRGEVPVPGSRRPDYATLYFARMLAGDGACVTVRCRGQEANERAILARVLRLLPRQALRTLWR